MTSSHEVCTLHYIVGAKYGHNDIHWHSKYKVQEEVHF